MININSYEPSSYIYGPGKRFVIWVQGCSLHCKGCWNQHMWSFKTHSLYSVKDLVKLILSFSDVEGITLLGGEPMHQAKELLTMIKLLKKHGLTTFLYTGYNFDELSEPAQVELFRISDIAVSGRFISHLRDTSLQWRGSSNQIIHFNTEAYNNVQVIDGNYCQINLRKDGSMSIIGYPSDELIEDIK